MTWDVVTGATAHGVLIAWLVALGISPFAVYLAIALHGRWVSRHPTADGRVPRDHPLAVRYYDVKALEARRGWLPESFTYSPHTRNELPVPPEPIAALPAPALTLEQVLSLEGICYGSRVDTGEPVLEQRVLSVGIGGRPGSGKSNTVSLLALQYARAGAVLFLSDPHAGHPDSMVNRLQPLIGRDPGGASRTAESPRETLHLLERVVDQLEQRKRSWRRQGGQESPLVAIVDEWPESLRLLPPHDRERLLDLVQLLGYAGRKYQVAVVLVAQSWQVVAIGSSQIRNPLRAAVVHAMRSDEARVLAGVPPAAWPADPQDLPVGEAFICGVDSGIARVRLPLVNGVPTASEWRPAGVPPALPPPSGRRSDAVLEDADAVPDAVVDAVLAAFRGGQGLTAAIRSAAGVRPGGRQYDSIRAAVEAALRDARNE